MKAKLIFDVPEERKAFMAAAKADNMAIVLWNIHYNMRRDAKDHFEQTGAADPSVVIDYIFELFEDEMHRGGIIIDDLTE